MKSFRSLAIVLSALTTLSACKEKTSTADEGVDAAPQAATETTGATQSTGPALWEVSDEDTKIYLFGTVHVLPVDLEWRTAKIEAAMAESDAVYFETDIEPDANLLMQTVTELGLYPNGQRLSDQLTEAQSAKLAEACSKLGVSLPVVDAMKPWLAAMTLSERMIERAGYNPESGVERTLSPVAVDAGKQIRKFETVEEQLRILADMPEQVQIDYLMDGIEEIENESKILEDLVAAWAKGDVDQLANIMIQEELADNPQLYEALLVKRNRNWAIALQTLAENEPGSFFVAVGAAHLAGKDSLIDMLDQRGLESRRLE